jgi:hypothetical protein
VLEEQSATIGRNVAQCDGSSDGERQRDLGEHCQGVAEAAQNTSMNVGPSADSERTSGADGEPAARVWWGSFKVGADGSKKRDEALLPMAANRLPLPKTMSAAVQRFPE